MTSHSFHLRDFRAADTEDLVRIWYEASRRAHPFLSEALHLERSELIRSVYLPRAETIVAAAEAPLGFLSLLGNFVGGLFVAPQAQDLGIGRALIGHARARKGQLTLEVYTANQRAMGFYQAQGFREISRRPCDDHGDRFENAKMILD